MWLGLPSRPARAVCETLEERAFQCRLVQATLVLPDLTHRGVYAKESLLSQPVTRFLIQRGGTARIAQWK